MFRKLRDHDGTPLIALDRDELRVDGVLDDRGEIPDEQPMHIQRVGRGCYLIRAVNEDILPSPNEVFFE